MRTKLSNALVVFAAAATVAACSPTVQTTSGAAYIERYQTPTAQTATGFRKKIREAALVEPTLRFPARIGLARVEGGRLTPIPLGEAEAWLKTKSKIGPWFGEMVPISPLIAALAAGDVGHAKKKDDRPYWRRQRVDLDHLVQRIRLGAARQHVDAVLIYEVIGRSRESGTPLNVADLTIIGAYLFPSRVLKAKGFASALLVDVRNGYPYGTAQTVVDRKDLAPTVWSTEKTRLLGPAAKTAAVVKLTADVEKMMYQLYAKLPQQRATQ